MSPGPWEPQPRMRKTLFDVLPEGGASTRARARYVGDEARGARERGLTKRNRRATQWTRIIYRPSGAGTRRRREWDTAAEA
jgi:hypothetical protein